MALEVEVRFASAGAGNAFAEELTQLVARLVEDSLYPLCRANSGFVPNSACHWITRETRENSLKETRVGRTPAAGRAPQYNMEHGIHTAAFPAGGRRDIARARRGRARSGPDRGER